MPNEIVVRTSDYKKSRAYLASLLGDDFGKARSPVDVHVLPILGAGPPLRTPSGSLMLRGGGYYILKNQDNRRVGTIRTKAYPARMVIQFEEVSDRDRSVVDLLRNTIADRMRRRGFDLQDGASDDWTGTQPLAADAASSPRGIEMSKTFGEVWSLVDKADAGDTRAERELRDYCNATGQDYNALLDRYRTGLFMLRTGLRYGDADTHAAARLLYARLIPPDLFEKIRDLPEQRMLEEIKGRLAEDDPNLSLLFELIGDKIPEQRILEEIQRHFYEPDPVRSALSELASDRITSGGPAVAQDIVRKPPKPKEKTNGGKGQDWIDYYHAMKRAELQITLERVADDSGFSLGYLKQLHEGCTEDTCRRNTTPKGKEKA